MFGFSKCPFCKELAPELNKQPLFDDEGPPIKCDCSTFQNRYYCHKSGCSKRKGENNEYCYQHKNCCKEEYCQDKAVVGEYCNSHKNFCKSCGGRNSVEGGYCWNHRCRAYNCNKEVSTSQDYCSDHIKSCPYCSNHMTQYKECCDECTQNCKCKYYLCWTIVPPPQQQGPYCINHKAECHYNSIKPNDDKRCEKRLRNYGEKCEDHQKKCEFEKCRRWVNSYSNHCPQHPPQEQARLYREERNSLQNQLNNRPNITNHQYNNLVQERGDLQTKLNNANAKINRAQTNLGIGNLDNLATELQNPAGDIWSLARWKEELEIEKSKNEIIDNFYRRQFILNNDVEDVRNELSEQILEANQENKQKEQEINDLKEIIENLENLIIQDKDIFLSEKIDNKRNQLEQLKTNLRNNLNGNWHETLDDILEAQTVFIKSNNDLTLGQLTRFKQRLLNSRQITQKDLKNVCQVQAELVFLELKAEQEQNFQAQIEISRNN